MRRTAYVFAGLLSWMSSASAESPTFTHELLDSVLSHRVDDGGSVDYRGLAQDHRTLDRYLDQVAACSPTRCPERFPSAPHALAYWINAYNAFVLRGVLDRFPIARLDEGEGGLDAFFSKRLFVAGGDSLTLNDIENSIIRPRFSDPRIHFAVNCAATSCPALDARAYRADDLGQHLDRQAQRFARDPRHVRFENGRLRLSRIMDWYGEDFVKWFPRDRMENPPEAPGLIDYVLLYLPESQAALLRAAGDVPVDFADYDWSLNIRQPLGD